MQENNPQVVYSWKAPLRPYKKQGRIILRFYLALALLLSLIVFFFGDKILLIPIWALLFLFYVLTITPPPEVENKITRFGIETTGITLRWESLSHFYFGKRFGFEVLTLVGQPPYYYHVYLVLKNKEMKQELIHLLSDHLIYQEKPQKTFIDKIIDWFSNLIPDEEENQGVLQKMQPVSP
jgi:hypothetical protein